MLLSPIFLALGAVATSVLNAGGRFAAVGHRADRLQPRDHRRRAHPRPDARRRRAWRSASSLGSLWPPARPGPPAGADRVPLRAADRRSATPQARKALVLMAPRAIGLGVTQITFIVVTALATHARRGRRDGLQLRLRAAPDPARDHRRAARRSCVLPSLSREAARRSRAGVRRRCSTRALRLLIFVMVPIARPDRGRPRSRSSRSCSAAARSARPDLDLIADHPASASWSA